MSKYIIVNASARAGGTSALLAGLCKTFLTEHGRDASVVSLYQSTDIGAVVDAVLAAETVIISGPCYVNTYPAPVIRLLGEWASRVPRDQMVYGMIQGGMPYPHTHKSGLNLLAVFAEKTGLNYGGGFVMGLGVLADGKSLDNLPNGKRVKRQLALFFSNIRDGKPSGDGVYENAKMKIPSILARIMAAAMNRSIDKKFAARGMDAHAPSPYQSDELS